MKNIVETKLASFIVQRYGRRHLVTGVINYSPLYRDNCNDRFVNLSWYVVNF